MKKTLIIISLIVMAFACNKESINFEDDAFCWDCEKYRYNVLIETTTYCGVDSYFIKQHIGNNANDSTRFKCYMISKSN